MQPASPLYVTGSTAAPSGKAAPKLAVKADPLRAAAFLPASFAFVNASIPPAPMTFFGFIRFSTLFDLLQPACAYQEIDLPHFNAYVGITIPLFV